MAAKAIEVFEQILKPNEIILTLLFNACAQLESAPSVRLVKQASSTMPQSAYSNPRLITSLIDALMKCGDVEGAEALFNRTTKKPIEMSRAMMSGKLDIVQTSIIGWIALLSSRFYQESNGRKSHRTFPENRRFR